VAEHSFGTRYGGAGGYAQTVHAHARNHAATAQRFATVTVQPGDTLWSIASTHTSASGDVQETIDAISAANHLQASMLQPGEKLRIPQ
jgi:Tfp pilus assembly protein FimV